MIKEPDIDEVEARKFLLGLLSPEEQGQIEELAFENPDTFTFLESIQDDLIEDFLHDELSPLERQRFNDHFLSFPGRRQDLEISQVLKEHFDVIEPEEVITTEPKEREVVPEDDPKISFAGFFDRFNIESFWLRATTAAILLALLIIAVWLIRTKEERQPDPVQAGPGTPVHVPSPDPQVSPSLDPSPSPVQAVNKPTSRTPEKQKSVPAPEKEPPVLPYATLLVPSAVSRGSGGEPLLLPPDASSVRLGLALINQTNFKTYDVKLENEAGTELHHWHNLRAQNFPATQDFQATKGLLLDVRTNLLKPDESYYIVVTGVSSKGERSILEGYSFEAKK